MEELGLVDSLQYFNLSDICLIEMCFDSGDVSIPLFFLVLERNVFVMGIGFCCQNLRSPIGFVYRTV